MKKIIILKAFLVLVLFCSISCDKDDSIEKTLPGEWIEVEPVSDRTTLIFSSQNSLTRIDGEGNEENYNYEIKDDAIFLSLASGQEGSSELFFQKLDPGRFRIGNLYPSIPEGEEVIMTFERL
jgi:hypothetical protein